MVEFLVKGVTVGFSAGGMFGPLQGFLINTSIKHGWRRGMLIVIAPLIIDVPIVLAVLFALSALQNIIPVLVDGIRILGGAFVLYLAWGAFRDYRAGVNLMDSATNDDLKNDTAQGIFLRGLLMNVLSPGPYIFWTTVNGPTLLQAFEQSAWHGIVFMVAFYGSFLGMMTLMNVGIDRLRAVDERFTRLLLLIIALILLAFGIFLLWDGFIGIVASLNT